MAPTNDSFTISFYCDNYSSGIIYFGFSGFDREFCNSVSKFKKSQFNSSWNKVAKYFGSRIAILAHDKYEATVSAYR